MAETIRTPIFTRYDVREKLGSGGMGTVYRARDLRLDRWVALKVLPPALREHPELLARFKREARVLARLKHPGVASVHDIDVEGDFPFMVMEFVEGDNLEQVLAARGPLPMEEVVRIGGEIADALEHIHSRRIVHRDVKSANIVIGPEGRAVITDLGIALVASLPRLSHGTLGTPEYMSPEQADGRTMDGRSDLYSVGVVLYECLTGQLPFERDGDSLASLTAVLHRIIEEPALPVRTLRREVPSWLAEVVERCLAKDPEERFTRAADLAAALQQGRGEEMPLAPSGPASVPEAAPVVEASTLVLSHAEPVEAVAFGPDGQRMATACKDRMVRVWDVRAGRLLHKLKGPSALSVSFRPGGVYLASGCVDGAIRIWDIETERLLHTIQAHTGYVLSVAYSRGGDLLASGAMDGAVHIWQAKTGRLLRTLEQHTGYILSVSFSPDGKHLASGSADGQVRIWDVKTGDRKHRLEGHAGYVPSVAFSPDGKHLASGGVDGAVRIWNVETGRLRHKMSGHKDWVMSVTFGPDGKRLASAGRDQTVRLWDSDRGQALVRMKGHTGPVMSVAFGPRGRRLASGSQDHTARLWTVDEALLRRRRRVKRFATVVVVAVMVVAGLSMDRLPPLPDWLAHIGTETVEYFTGNERGPDEGQTPVPAKKSPNRAGFSATNARASKAGNEIGKTTRPKTNGRTKNAKRAESGQRSLSDGPPKAPPRKTPDDRATAGDQSNKVARTDDGIRTDGGIQIEAGDHAGAINRPQTGGRDGIDEGEDGADPARANYDRPAYGTDAPADDNASNDATHEEGAEIPAWIAGSDERLYSTEGIVLDQGGYTLVTAVESSRYEAQRRAGPLVQHGFRTGILGVFRQGRLTYRIVIGQYTTRASAAEVRRRLVAAEVIPFDTWLMRIRTKGRF